MLDSSRKIGDWIVKDLAVNDQRRAKLINLGGEDNRLEHSILSILEVVDKLGWWERRGVGTSHAGNH